MRDNKYTIDTEGEAAVLYLNKNFIKYFNSYFELYKNIEEAEAYIKNQSRL